MELLSPARTNHVPSTGELAHPARAGSPEGCFRALLYWGSLARRLSIWVTFPGARGHTCPGKETGMG